MTDKFLNKLRQIRQKYGISEAEYQKVETMNPQSLIDVRKSTIEPSSLHQGTGLVYRNKSSMKRSFHQYSEDPHQDIYDQMNRKRLISRELPSRGVVNQSNSLRSSSLIMHKNTQRASSQPKMPLSNYNSIDKQNLKPVGSKYSHQYQSKFTSTAYTSSNIQNLKILYEPLAKPVQSIPAFSYSREPLQPKNPNAWTIDKLSHVQDKIKAYLRK